LQSVIVYSPATRDIELNQRLHFAQTFPRLVRQTRALNQAQALQLRKLGKNSNGNVGNRYTTAQVDRDYAIQNSYPTHRYDCAVTDKPRVAKLDEPVPS